MNKLSLPTADLRSKFIKGDQRALSTHLSLVLVEKHVIYRELRSFNTVLKVNQDKTLSTYLLIYKAHIVTWSLVFQLMSIVSSWHGGEVLGTSLSCSQNSSPDYWAATHSILKVTRYDLVNNTDNGGAPGCIYCLADLRNKWLLVIDRLTVLFLKFLEYFHKLQVFMWWILELHIIKIVSSYIIWVTVKEASVLLLYYQTEQSVAGPYPLRSKNLWHSCYDAPCIQGPRNI